MNYKSIIKPLLKFYNINSNVELQPDHLQLKTREIISFNDLETYLSHTLGKKLIQIDLSSSVLLTKGYLDRGLSSDKLAKIVIGNMKNKLEKRVGLTKNAIDKYNYDIPTLKYLLGQRLQEEAIQLAQYYNIDLPLIKRKGENI